MLAGNPRNFPHFTARTGDVSSLPNSADAISASSVPHYWNRAACDVLKELHTSEQGLSKKEAQRKLSLYGRNVLRASKKTASLGLLLKQFESPLILILLAASILSFFLNEPIDASIIISIVVLSGVLAFWQEKRAVNAVELLLAMVRVESRVLRDGCAERLPRDQIVRGDICLLSAGDIIPADALLLESKDLFVEEASLTGESYPAEKHVGLAPADAGIAQRSNSLFMGTHVVSGTARAVVVATGAATEFGKVSERLRIQPSATEFERGIQRFGYLLTELTLVFVILIFAVTVFLQRPIIDSFLFSLAIAIGIIPELLPVIISITLAFGALHMARYKVIVKQLASIENLGSMNVLCTDKTGTLTEGTMQLKSVVNVQGNQSDEALFLAYLNSYYETGFSNPIDDAVRSYATYDLTDYEKVDEVPYDFVRKRLSVLIRKGREQFIITKGAVPNIIEICSRVKLPDGTADIRDLRESITQRFTDLGSQGFRTLGLAYKDVSGKSRMKKDDEADMTFLGLLIFYDPPKAGMIEALNQLGQLGIRLQLISGDNVHVASAVMRSILGRQPQVLTGKELLQLSNEALRSRANSIDVFAEIEPNQKERIITSLRKSGNTVGFLGDGINDAPALHSADVGISVNSAADVAKEAATIVLLEKDLRVLSAGVREGRKTFANTLKYIYMTMSANFGNMFSMAAAALFLPFLPLLPKQILLNNFLSDFPAMAIAGDNVDAELIRQPQPWNISFIRRFMVSFGILSSVFDFLTFGLLLFVLNATPDEFRTGWFVESVLTEIVIIVVLRTWKPFYTSRPGRILTLAMCAVVVITVMLPYSPLNRLLGLTPLPLTTMFLLGLLTIIYALFSEIQKKLFYKAAHRKVSYQPNSRY